MAREALLHHNYVHQIMKNVNKDYVQFLGISAMKIDQSRPIHIGTK